MTAKIKKQVYVLSILITLTACSRDNLTESKGTPVAGRWYTQELVTSGEQVFIKNCALCHGRKAQGLAKDWRQPLPDGSYPPPPLNGSAHAWHHPMNALLHTINKGGAAYGGKMPGFEQQLSQQEKESTIAYFQHFWSDDIYQRWQQR